MGVVDPDAELHGHRDVRALGGAHRRGDDLAEQPPLERQRGTAAAPGDLGHRAAEVHVDVVGQPLVSDHFRGGEGGVRVDGVELQRARRLVRRERRHVHGDGMALDERAGGHHLAHVEPADRPGPGELEFAAQRAECDVGHAGHRGQHDGAPQLDRPDPQPGAGFGQDADDETRVLGGLLLGHLRLPLEASLLGDLELLARLLEFLDELAQLVAHRARPRR